MPRDTRGHFATTPGAPCTHPRAHCWRSHYLKPHGTMAAVRRHRRHHEPLCHACGQAERRNSADRYAAKLSTA